MIVYLDESGDLGFDFRKPKTRKNSKASRLDELRFCGYLSN